MKQIQEKETQKTLFGVPIDGEVESIDARINFKTNSVEIKHGDKDD